MNAQTLRKLGFDDAADALRARQNEREAARIRADHRRKNPGEDHFCMSPCCEKCGIVPAPATAPDAELSKVEA